MSEENGDRAASLLSELRAQHETIKAENTKKFPLPGADWLLAEFEVLDYEVGQAIRRKALTGPDHGRKALNAYMDQLLAACVGFWVKESDADPVPLDPERPVKFDERLVRGLGLQVPADGDSPPAARDILYAVFAEFEPNEKRVPWVIEAFHDQYVLWAGGGDDEGAAAEAETAFLGS
jgi:hypothetical protein